MIRQKKAKTVGRGEVTLAKAQSTPSSDGRDVISLEELFTFFSPNFAALASLRRCSGHALREIFRGSIAAQPRQVLGGDYTPDKVPTA